MSNEWDNQHSLSGKLDTFYTSLDAEERKEFVTILRAAAQNRPADPEVAGYNMLDTAWGWIVETKLSNPPEASDNATAGVYGYGFEPPIPLSRKLARANCWIKGDILV